MNTSRRLPDDQAVALRYLRYLIVREGGYRWHGVLGWALREDVEHATGKYLPERLSRLHARGLLDRVDVRAPRLPRPAWMYRITQAGSDEITARDRLAWRSIPPVSRASEDQPDTAIYIAPAALQSLQALRRAMERRAMSQLMPREPGWCTLRDLRVQIVGEEDVTAAGTWDLSGRRMKWRGEDTEEEDAEEEDDSKTLNEPWRAPWEAGDWIDELAGEGSGWDILGGETPTAPVQRSPGRDGLDWLVRAGLVQKWVVKPDRGRPVPLYRITNLGGVALPIEWQEPR